MTTTRKAHVRRTASGKRTKVRRHKVDARTTAGNLLDASGVTRLLSPSRGAARIGDGIDRARHRGQRAVGAVLVTAGLLEIGAWGIGRTSWGLGLLGLAGLFAGIGLLTSGYAPPKRTNRPVRRASIDHAGRTKAGLEAEVRAARATTPGTRITHDGATYYSPKPGKRISARDLALIETGRDAGLPAARHQDRAGVWRWGNPPARPLHDWDS